MDIKVGDKVRCTVDCTLEMFNKGDEFIVDSINGRKLRRSNDKCDYMEIDQVDLVAEEPKSIQELKDQITSIEAEIQSREESELELGVWYTRTNTKIMIMMDNSTKMYRVANDSGYLFQDSYSNTATISRQFPNLIKVEGQ
jgi:hypothetical protein